MTRVMVEFPIEEAEGLLKRVAPDGTVSMNAAECLAAEAGRDRLEQAVRVERGAGGLAEMPPTVKDRAEALIGQAVRVYCKDGTSDSGTMMSGTPAVLYIEVSDRKSRGIPYDRVSRIEPVLGAAA